MKERDTEIIKKLADRIVLLRAARRWSQENLAVETGLHRNYIGHVERGEVNPGLTNINKFARAFDMPIDELMRF